MSPSPSVAVHPPLGQVARYGGRVVSLAWSTRPGLTSGLAGATLLASTLPALAAWVGKLIVDGVLRAAASGLPGDRREVIVYVLAEAAIMALLVGARRGHGLFQDLLHAHLGYRMTSDVLDKALGLTLSQHEDPEIKALRVLALRDAASRPFRLLTQIFAILQHAVALVVLASLLIAFSPLAIAVIVLAGLPAFLVEAHFSGRVFRFYQARTPEVQERTYLERLMTRDDFAKEVLLFDLGTTLRARYRQLFERLFTEDRSLQVRRAAWGFGLSLLSSAAFYGAYVWIALEAVAGRITLGEMTMALALFRQGQNAVGTLLGSVGGVYEEALYVSNIFAFLAVPSPSSAGTVLQGARPGDGLRCEAVGFTYLGAARPAVEEVSFHLAPGQLLGLVGANGSGKTTLIKLVLGLYSPDSGRILLDGTDLRDWDPTTLRRRLGALFQGFQRYKLTAAENIAAGDRLAMEDLEQIARAAHQGRAESLLAELPEGLATLLGKRHSAGLELSAGQWQRLALARAFMRREADVLVLDEPTSATDAAAEQEIFEHLRASSVGRMTILVSHRLSNVRQADRILMLDRGRVLEEGTHQALMARGGHYSRWFLMQASGYQAAAGPRLDNQPKLDPADL